MKITKKEEIRSLSFPDTKVISMNLDLAHTTFIIQTDTAFLSNKKIDLKQCKVSVSNWKNIGAKIYYSDTKCWKILSLFNLEPLVDICEFEVTENSHIIFRGFGKESGQWIELDFTSADICVDTN